MWKLIVWHLRFRYVNGRVITGGTCFTTFIKVTHSNGSSSSLRRSWWPSLEAKIVRWKPHHKIGCILRRRGLVRGDLCQKISFILRLTILILSCSAKNVFFSDVLWQRSAFLEHTVSLSEQSIKPRAGHKSLPRVIFATGFWNLKWGQSVQRRRLLEIFHVSLKIAWFILLTNGLFFFSYRYVCKGFLDRSYW